MNVLVKRLFFLSLLSLSLCGAPAMGNIFLDAAEGQQDQIEMKSVKKTVTHKSPLEFKQAVARYIKHTDSQCFQISQRHTDENVSYKKELRYLFKNYGKFSTASLLSRLRSAHQEMVKRESNVDSDVYKRYEQISSALLLICAQVFFNDARSQILEALHELDNLIAYWQYQYHHPVRYFFGKSPVKWVMGKSQEKEILYNLNSLERKQKELYTLLGMLTGHIHVFTESGTTYNDCYAWIEELFVVLSSLKGSSIYNLDGSRFDTIAAQLESKIKHVGVFKNDCLSSVAFARQSNHFIRNWIAYTTLVAGTGYILHYHAQHPEMLPAALTGVQDSAKYLLVLLVDPLNKIYKRMKTAFSSKVESTKDNVVSDKDNNQVLTKQEQEIQEEYIRKIKKIMKDLDTELEVSFDDIPQEAKKIVSDIANELSLSKDIARERLFGKLEEAAAALKKPNDGSLWNSNYQKEFPEVKQKQLEVLMNKVKTERVKPIFDQNKCDEKGEPIIVNKKEWDEYLDAKKNLQAIVGELTKATTMFSGEGWSAFGKLLVFDILFDVVDDFGEPLKRYTDIIDQHILKAIRSTITMFVNLSKRGDLLAQHADYLLNKADREIEAAKITMHDLVNKIDTKLQDQELTFWFASLIPLIGMGTGTTMMYKWIIKKNYSPIRIALADINSLLIESAMQLDDHDYGKLVYLICKLRSKAQSLKGAVSNEFLADVAKLESKAYTAQTKRDIVDNMFNKYAFLGRIAV